MDWYPPSPACPLCEVKLPPSPFTRSCFCDTCRPGAAERAVWVDEVRPGQWFVVLWSREGIRFERGHNTENGVPMARRANWGRYEIVPIAWKVVIVQPQV